MEIEINNLDEIGESQLVDLMNGTKTTGNSGVVDLGLNEKVRRPAPHNEKAQEIYSIYSKVMKLLRKKINGELLI